MMNRIKKVLLGVLTLAIIGISAIAGGFGITETKAATVSASEKKNIVELCKSFGCYFGVNYYESDADAKKYGKKVNVTFSNWGKEDTSKSSTIENVGYFINNTYSMEDIFGVKGVYVDRLSGDWGESYPDVKVTSISKKSGNKYSAKCDLRWIDYNSKVKKVGNATFTLKKKSGARFGFVVKSLSYKMTAGIQMTITKSSAKKGIKKYLDSTMPGWDKSGYMLDIEKSGGKYYVYVKHMVTMVYQCFVIDAKTSYVEEYDPLVIPELSFYDSGELDRYFQGTFYLSAYL